MDRDRAGRHRHHQGREIGDGPGRIYRAADAGRRRARMRLAQGQGGVRARRRKCPAQSRLGQHVDRRQPRHQLIAAGAAQGRRHRAHHADRRRQRAMERAGERMQRREQRDHASSEWAHGHIRCRRRGGRGRNAAGASPLEGAQGLEADRYAAKAYRGRRQGNRPADLRHRRAPSEHAVRRDRAVSGVQGNAGFRRREPHCRDEGRAPHRQAAGLGGGGGRLLVAGEKSRRRAADHLEFRQRSPGVQRQHPCEPAVRPRSDRCRRGLSHRRRRRRTRTSRQAD